MARRPAAAVSTPTDDLDTTLERVALTDVRPHPRNYQTHPESELAHLMQSLTTNGVYRNVVIAREGTLLAGHGVVEAARRLGYTHLSMKRLDVAPDSPRALQLLVGDNEIVREAQRNEEALMVLLQEISAEDPTALLGTGFDEMTLAALLDEPAPRLTQFAPSLTPEERTPAVTPADLVAAATRHQAQITQQTDFLPVICPQCLYEFALDRSTL